MHFFSNDVVVLGQVGPSSPNEQQSNVKDEQGDMVNEQLTIPVSLLVGKVIK